MRPSGGGVGEGDGRVDGGLVNLSIGGGFGDAERDMLGTGDLDLENEESSIPAGDVDNTEIDPANGTVVGTVFRGIGRNDDAEVRRPIEFPPAALALGCRRDGPASAFPVDATFSPDEVLKRSRRALKDWVGFSSSSSSCVCSDIAGAALGDTARAGTAGAGRRVGFGEIGVGLRTGRGLLSDAKADSVVIARTREGLSGGGCVDVGDGEAGVDKMMGVEDGAGRGRGSVTAILDNGTVSVSGAERGLVRRRLEVGGA